MTTQIKISVQSQDFNLAEEVALLENDNISDGAVVTFTGRVRNQNLDSTVTALCLEHYPGMTENALQQIAQQAAKRWQLGKICIIHRIGELKVGEQIVFVGVTSCHRGDAYAANEFIMDFLKTRAPFWKKETTLDGQRWIEAKASDQYKADKWQ